MAPRQPRSGFSRLPKAAVYDPRLTDRDVRVLAALGVYADRSGTCWPALGTVAKGLGVSRQAVQRQVRRLEGFGYVATAPQKRGTGGSGPNLYQLRYPPLYPSPSDPKGAEAADPDGATPNVAPEGVRAVQRQGLQGGRHDGVAGGQRQGLQGGATPGVARTAHREQPKHQPTATSPNSAFKEVS